MGMHGSNSFDFLTDHTGILQAVFFDAAIMRWWRISFQKQ